jgi:hypothetical protein
MIDDVSDGLQHVVKGKKNCCVGFVKGRADTNEVTT